MAKHELELVELTNMCMIYDKKTDKVLVQVRDKNDWDGISFPGGHVEKGESFNQSVIREVLEETGLLIENLIPCGIKDWYDFKKQKRYAVLMYKTKMYSGTLIPRSHEGENKWMTIDSIRKSELVAPDFIEMLDIMLGTVPYTEFFYEDTKNEEENKRWVKKLY